MGSACSGGHEVASSADEGGPKLDHRPKDNPAANGKSQSPPPPLPPQTIKNGGDMLEPPREQLVADEPIPPTTITHEIGGTTTMIAAGDDDLDAELKNIDGGPAQYKLVYFAGLRFRAEAIRLILRYANVPYEEQLVSFADWPQMKGSTPMGGLPLLYIGNRVLCQANAIGRFLAKKYGLYGKNNLESGRVDMLVDAMSDVLNELGALVMEQDPGKKSDLWHQLKDDVVCPFLDRCIKMLAGNDSGWFVGDEATWADLAISELLGNISEKVDSTLLDTYPALRAHINGVRALPHIAEYVAERPDAAF